MRIRQEVGEHFEDMNSRRIARRPANRQHQPIAPRYRIRNDLYLHRRLPHGGHYLVCRYQRAAQVIPGIGTVDIASNLQHREERAENLYRKTIASKDRCTIVASNIVGSFPS